MYNYINQSGSNLLIGVDVACYVQRSDLILQLTGEPDPSYNPSAPDLSLRRPLAKLHAILEQLGEITVAQLVCTTHCDEDACGCIHCMLGCPINSDARPIGIKIMMKDNVQAMNILIFR